MVKLNSLGKWIMVILLSFGAGALFFYLVQSQKPIRIVEKSVETTLASNSEQATVLSDGARKKYQGLMSEYSEYIRNSENKEISFKEFMSIKKDKLVQNKKYTEQDIQTDEEIKRWFNSYTSTQGVNNTETNKYSISGTVVSPYKNKHACYISINLYLQPIEDKTPKEPPIATTFIEDCRGGDFALDFLLSNFIEKETPPVYIAAYAFDGASSTYLWPLAYGTDEKINGIPPSLLVKRKNNDPVKIQIKEIDRKQLESSTMNINSNPSLWATIYGVDSISKLAPELGIYKTNISGQDGVARLTGVPLASNVYTQIFNPNENNKISIVVPTFVGNTTLEIPQDVLNIKNNSTNPSLVIFPPNNLTYGEFVLSSNKSLKNKNTLVFNNMTKEPLIVNDMDLEESLLELKHNNESLGIMSIKLKKNETLIITPVPKKIQKLTGTLSYIKAANTSSFCKECIIELKYTDKTTSSNSSGEFTISDIGIIDDQLEMLIDSKDQRFIVPLLIHNDAKKIELNLELPNKKLIELWNKTSPTLPINGIVYGVYTYHKSYRAFLKGIGNNSIYESAYFDDNTGLPSRNKYSTSSLNTKNGFSKFIFPDVASGTYVIYIVAGPNVIHSRLVNVESGAITIVY